MSGTEVQCLCGTVKLRLEGGPIAQFYCHCDDCQAVHGGAYVPRAVYPVDAVTVLRGETTAWTLKTTVRTRCKACGTHLFAAVPAHGICGVNGYLLPPAMFKPEFHIHCRYAVLPVKDGLPHYKSLPVRFGGSDETVGW